MGTGGNQHGNPGHGNSGHGSHGNHGGHGGGGNHGDDRANQDLLTVEAGAIPALRDGFASALARIDRELELANGLRVTPWAADPVSKDAATGINEHAVDAETAAFDALRSFRDQLVTAVDNLDKSAEQYRLLEEDNSVTVGQQGNPGN